ncbi:MAG: hypothetical protein WCJ61_14380, partial [Paludibacter sp.]
MKSLIISLVLSLSFTSLCISQNVLFLKSGNKMTGKLVGYKNDSIIFKLQGNKLKFKTSDILSIYFDELLAPLDLNKTKKIEQIKTLQDGKIFGVITYYFNKNYGDKPDVGTEVYIAEISKVPDFNLATVDSFYYASFYRNTYLEYKSVGTVPDNILEQVKKYNVENKSSFDLIDKRSFMNIYQIKVAKDVLKSVVDGGGNYSVKVKPGIYYIYIKSNNRQGLSLTEVRGKIKCKKLNVKEGEEVNFSYNFE